MKYDFTTQVNRIEQGSRKWQGMYQKKPDADAVPLTMADMELLNAPEIIEGLKDYLSNDAILGYTAPTDKYYDAVINWMKRRHDWDIQKEWI